MAQGRAVCQGKTDTDYLAEPMPNGTQEQAHDKQPFSVRRSFYAAPGEDTTQARAFI